jgi:hypothetical protein
MVGGVTAKMEKTKAEERRGRRGSKGRCVSIFI